MMVPERVIHVTIVSLGDKYYKTYHAFNEMTKRSKKPWRFYDVRDKLTRDPSTGGIGNKEDGSWRHTQTSVIAQEGFPAVIESLVRSVVKDKIYAQALCCTQGVHRANTSARFSENILNSMICEDDDGLYRFSAKYFPLGTAYGKQDSGGSESTS